MGWIPFAGWRRERQVAGYREGETLARGLLDIGDQCIAECDGAEAELGTADGKLRFQVREKVQTHFMMHLVTLEFGLRMPCVLADAYTVDIGHAGTLRRRSLEFKVKRGARGDFQPLLLRLSGSGALSEALMLLDFQRCQLIVDSSGYRVCIEPYGASEVVSRMPALRNYVRLTQSQSRALLSALAAFRDLLRP